MHDTADGASATLSSNTFARSRGRRGIWRDSVRIAGSAGALLAVLLAGCERQPSLDQELYITELETQVAQLEADLSAAYQEVSRLSGTLSTQVAGLEGSMSDLNLRILDLPGAADVPAAVREVEAGMAVAMQRVRDVRGTTDSLAQYLQ